MGKVFLVSDTHFGHKGVTHFLRGDGSKLRPWDNPDDMDEAMIQLWNETVGPNDKVYHLGDVVINRKALSVLSRLNGDKVLIKGNHDIFKLSDYTQYFRDVRGYHVLNGMILSHIPVHTNQLARFGTNIHGHTHSERVKKISGVNVATGELLFSTENDVRYHCVCVEQTDFKPIEFDEVVARIQSEGGTIGFTKGNS